MNTKNIILAFLALLAFTACNASRWTAKTAEKRARQVWRSTEKKLAAKVVAPSFSLYIVKPFPQHNSAEEVKNCRATLQKAIDDCHKVGGGSVLVPCGRFLCDGPLHLKSGVNLHLEKGAVLRFDTVPQQYLPLVKVRWEGTVCWNYSPMIYAIGQKNIGITGEGTLDGQALSYWKNWRSKQDPAKKRLRQMGNDRTADDTRRFGEGHWLRPSLVEFYECENILVEGVTLRESPFWTLHPVFSKNITLRNLHIQGGFWNDDGIDPDSCEDVLIENCNIHTHDDAISIKAGRDQDAWERPGSRNIWVRNCTLVSEKANALCIGSELSGGVEQVYFERCSIPMARFALNFKTNNDRGGYVRQIYVRQLDIDTCSESLLFFQTNYHSYRGGNFPTQFSDFFLQDLQCGATDTTAVRMNGLPTAPIERVFLSRVKVQRPGGPWVVEEVRELVD